MLSLSIAGAKVDVFFDTCNSYLKKIFFFPIFFRGKIEIIAFVLTLRTFNQN